jgi:zinc protease
MLAGNESEGKGEIRMKKYMANALLLLGALVPGASAQQAAAPPPAELTVSVPYREFTLPNGLRVIVHEDHSTPIVSVNTWYHVGSRNERAGRTGFAHLFEHLMFEGSKNVQEGQFDQLLEAAGANNNGSTSPDRTNYYEDGPSSALELMLYLDADRMGWLPEAMTEAKLNGQRDVVKNERRQSLENRPYGLAFEKLSAALYPAGHPYHHQPIGSMEDLEAAKLQDVIDFFRTYYAPNNASMAIAGDVSFETVRELVTKYFSEIPRGPAVPPVQAQMPELTSEQFLTYEDQVQLPRLYKSWHSPSYYKAGDAEMDVLASILTDGKSSRLYKKLVYEDQIAQDVGAFQSSTLYSSTFNVIITAKPDIALSRIDAAVENELREIATNGVTPAELERARNKIETSFIDALQHIGDFGGKADRLNGYLFYTGTPGFAQEDLARYRRITPAALQEAARRYLVEKNGVTLSVVPKGKTELAAQRSAS